MGARKGRRWLPRPLPLWQLLLLSDLLYGSNVILFCCLPFGGYIMSLFSFNLKSMNHREGRQAIGCCYQAGHQKHNKTQNLCDSRKIKGLFRKFFSFILKFQLFFSCRSGTLGWNSVFVLVFCLILALKCLPRVSVWIEPHQPVIVVLSEG